MSCDVGDVTERLENELCYDYNYELCSFSNLSATSPKSQLILQLFRCFTYVRAYSPTLLSLLLRHRLFTYVIWRAAHAYKRNMVYLKLIRFPLNWSYGLAPPVCVVLRIWITYFLIIRLLSMLLKKNSLPTAKPVSEDVIALNAVTHSGVVVCIVHSK